MDNTNALDTLWAAVIRESENMERAYTVYGRGAKAVDRNAPADDLLSWADDWGAYGDETNFRAAVMDYTLIRDGAPVGMTPEDYAAALVDLHARSGEGCVRDACIADADAERGRLYVAALYDVGTLHSLDHAETLAEAVGRMRNVLL